MSAPALDFSFEPEGGRLRLMDIGHGADLYLGELARMGRTPRTRETYRRTLYELDEHYPRHDVDTVTASMLREFLDRYQFNRKRGGNQPNSKATLAQRITHVACFFEWLHEEELIRHNPAARLKRPKLAPAYENDNVVTISTEDARLLLLEANRSAWPERLAVNLAIYTGARRHALAQVRRRDYDMVDRILHFNREKGGNAVDKPIADSLASVLEAAIIADIYDSDDDYLIPSLADQRREGDRDDRIVSRLIYRVAERAGVQTTVHAFRSAFATFYIERNGEEHMLSLQDLLGHKRGETTMVYLRRLNRRRNMETVRSLDWGVASPESFEALDGTEKEGFEPSIHAKPHGNRLGIPSEPEGHG